MNAPGRNERAPLLKRQLSREHLRGVLLEQIRSGALQPGDVLLSVQKLSAMYGLSMRAVQVVIRELIDQGWLYSRHRVGVYVAQHPGSRPLHNRPTTNKKVAILRHTRPDEFSSSTFFLEITRSLEQYLENHGVNVILAPLTEERTMEFLEREAEHISLVIVPVNMMLCRMVQRVALPCLTLVNLPDDDMGPCFDAVATENEKGAYEAVCHLVETGHREIAHLSAVGVSSGRERLAGYERAMQEAGLEVRPGHIVPTQWQVNEGYQGMLQILARQPRVTAVFAASDRLLFGALRALHECGRVIPDDISLVGFDDLDLAGHLQPPFTTVHWDRMHMGQVAGQLAMRRLEEPERAGRVIRLPARLVVRHSTRRRQSKEKELLATLAPGVT